MVDALAWSEGRVAEVRGSGESLRNRGGRSEAALRPHVM